MPETPHSPDPQDPADAPTTQSPPADPTGAAAPAPAPAPAPRRLLRSRDERVLGGVCGGLARYFNVDPLLVRIITVALIFVGGFAVVAYVAALLLVPEDDGAGQPVEGKPGRVSTIVGAFVIVLAGVALLNGDWGVGAGWFFGALAPTIVVVMILAVAGQRLLANRGEAAPAAAKIVGAGLVLCAILAGTAVAAAGAAVATAAGGGSAIAAVVIVLGLLMVGLSFKDSRARWLAVPALVLAIPSGVVAAAGVDVDHGIGDRAYRPATVADVKDYELGVGELEVDLRTMDWSSELPVRVKVDVGIGHALVLVPAGVCVEADTRAGLGWIDVLGDGNGGADIDDVRGTISRTTTGKRLLLDAHVGMGAVEVRHSRVGGDWDDRHHDGDDQIGDSLADAGCAGARA
jgi:phage shock protein PspC (stress-responsive transcriptional regulator)